MLKLRSNLTPTEPVKLALNVGALMDVSTGDFVEGMNGEHILLGGLGYLTGFTGIPNSFKSTLEHYKVLSASDRMSHLDNTLIETYDTELTIQEKHLKHMSQQFSSFAGRDLLQSGEWLITDRNVYSGNKWFEEHKKSLAHKRENRKELLVKTPFKNRAGDGYHFTLVPTFMEIDSFSKFETDDVLAMGEANELGESGANTLHMRQGLAKKRLINEISSLAVNSNSMTVLAAHIGKEHQMASGPYAPQPTKKMQHMEAGKKIKGITDDLLYLASNFWETKSVRVEVEKEKKTPLYPRNPEDNGMISQDLNSVELRLIRGKAAATGGSIQVWVSQEDGVLPSLTEFEFIKTSGRWGLDGNDRNYNLVFAPDIGLSRTTVRSKINSEPRLRRALTLAAEMKQLVMLRPSWRSIMMTPEDLFKKLKELGYDWDMLMGGTRAWWTFDNEDQPLKFLSTVDLLLMAQGKYFPYWMNADKSMKGG